MSVKPSVNYLLDTNVISENRKGTRADSGVQAFFNRVAPEQLYLPVQVIGEIQAGIAKAARKGDAVKARAFASWLDTLLRDYSDRIIDFDLSAARTWALLLSDEKKDPHTIDKQIAAIAIIHNMVVVTRDRGDAFSRIRQVAVLNPFSA